MDDSNDHKSNQRRCRSNCIRPSSSSMMRAPSWNPGFGAQTGDDVQLQDDEDELDQCEGQEHEEPNTFTIAAPTNATTQSNEIDFNQIDPELSKRIRLNIEFEIPTVYLKRNDQSKSSFHVYQMLIKSGPNAQWSIYKRYSQFLKFHHQLRQVLSAVKDVPFPPKKRLNSKASTIVQDRRRKLEQYMQRISEIVATLSICPADIEAFQRLVASAHDQSALSPSPTPSTQQAQGDMTEESSLNGSLHSEQDQEQEHEIPESELRSSAVNITAASARCLFYEFITPNTALDQTSV